MIVYYSMLFKYIDLNILFKLLVVDSTLFKMKALDNALLPGTHQCLLFVLMIILKAMFLIVYYLK